MFRLPNRNLIRHRSSSRGFASNHRPLRPLSHHPRGLDTAVSLEKLAALIARQRVSKYDSGRMNDAMGPD